MHEYEKKKVKKKKVFPRTKPNMFNSSLDRANAEITREINEISNAVARRHMLSQQERRIAESKMELKTAMEAHLMEQQTSLNAEVSGGRPKKEIVKMILRQCKAYNNKRIPEEIVKKDRFKKLLTLVLDLYKNNNDVRREAKDLLDSWFQKKKKLKGGGGSSPVSEAVFARIREDLGPRVERRCRAYAMKHS